MIVENTLYFVLEISFLIGDGIIQIWNSTRISTATMVICYMRGLRLSALRFGTVAK